MPCEHILKIKEICISHSNFSFSNSNRDIVLAAHEIITVGVKMEVNNCNCEGKEDVRRLRNRINELESKVSSSESSSSTQLVLRRNAETEKNNLEITKRNLESRNYDLQRERDNIQSLIKSGEKELDKKNEQIKQINNQLTTTQRDRDDYKNKWVLSDKEVKKITDSFNNLQIENNNKDNEIKTKEEKIISLQVRLGEAEGDILHRELISKERKLDELTRNLAIESQRVKNLREAYERLIHAREDYNRQNVATAQRDIDTIKQELLQTNINIEDLYKVYRNCEKVAEVRIKLEKIHEQKFEAHQEQPTNN